MNCRGWSRGDSGEEHEHQSDAVLGSVMVFRLAAGAVAEVVVPLGLAKAGFLSGSTGVLGGVAAAEERSEDAKFHACVGADDGHAQVASVRVLEDVYIIYSTVLYKSVLYCTVVLLCYCTVQYHCIVQYPVQYSTC